MKRGRKFFHPESYRLFTLSLVFFERKGKKEGRKGSRLNEITSGGKFDSIHLAYPVGTNDNFRARFDVWNFGQPEPVAAPLRKSSRRGDLIELNGWLERSCYPFTEISKRRCKCRKIKNRRKRGSIREERDVGSIR